MISQLVRDWLGVPSKASQASDAPNCMSKEPRGERKRSNRATASQREESSPRTIEVGWNSSVAPFARVPIINLGGCGSNVPPTAAWLRRNRPARSLHSPHQLDFLVIEENSFVEEADLAESIDAKHDTGAGNPIHTGCIWGSAGNRPDPQKAF